MQIRHRSEVDYSQLATLGTRVLSNCGIGGFVRVDSFADIKQFSAKLSIVTGEDVLRCARRLQVDAESPSVKLTEGWKCPPPRPYARGVISALNQDQFVEIAFLGDSFALHLNCHSYSGIISVTVDDNEPVLIDLYLPDEEAKGSIFIFSGFGEGEHRFRIKIVDRNPASSGTQCWLWSVLIDAETADRLRFGQSEGLRHTNVRTGAITLVSYQRSLGRMHHRVSPHEYFDFLKGATVQDALGWHPSVSPRLRERIEFERSISEANVIVYGNLESTEKYRDISMRYANFSKSRAVFWGIPLELANTEVDNLRSRPDLIGVRDAHSPYSWSPCVSCLMPELDQDASETSRQVGFLLSDPDKMKHHLSKEDFERNVMIFPAGGDMESIIGFIKGAEYLVTDNYLGAYWGILSNRKVVAVGHAEGELARFRHPVPVVAPEYWRLALKLARTYPEAREECIEQTLRFADRVADLFAV